MFVSLLISSLLLSAAVCIVINLIFRKTVHGLLQRTVPEDLAAAFQRYLQFAIYVIGIGGGVRFYQIERYVYPSDPDKNGKITQIVLNSDRWTLEMVRTVIETLQSIAWLLFLFFLIMLIAYLIVSNRKQH